MEWIIENWYILVAVLCLGAAVGIAVYRFAALPNDEQIKNLKEWLLLAVTRAEKDLGTGTGRLKLRSVYEIFLTKFPWLARVITFDKFSEMVDEALEEMEKMLSANKAAKEYVESGNS